LYKATAEGNVEKYEKILYEIEDKANEMREKLELDDQHVAALADEVGVENGFTD